MSLLGSNLSFRYSPDKILFADININIEAGEIVGLYGYSGSGKSTLGKILSGYLLPSAGYIEIDNIQLENKITSRLLANPVQMIHQHPERAINPRWKMKTVLDEANCNEQLLLDEIGIKPQWLHCWPSELSGGELQRFCIARSLISTTKYLIADEITTMLDGITQAQIWQNIINIVKQRQIGVLAISHDMDLINRICDRVIDFSQLNS